MCTFMVATVVAESLVSDIVPEGARATVAPRRFRHMTTVSKLWARMSVRSAAEVALMETESTSASAAEVTARVAYAEAEAAVHELGHDACKSLAKATIKDIVANIKATQEMLDIAAQKIADCNPHAEAAKKASALADEKAAAAAEKIKIVRDAELKAVKAKEEKMKADKQLQVAKKTIVHFGSQEMDRLVECNADKSICWNDYMMKVYQDGHTKMMKAQAHVKKCNREVQHRTHQVEEAKKKAEHGNHTSRTLMLEVRRTESLAQAAQNELAKVTVTKDSELRKCECSEERRYDAAWKTADNEKSQQTQKVAYTRAKHMLCVVNGVTQKDCTVHGMPKLEHANSGPLRNLIAELGDCSHTPEPGAGSAAGSRL